MRKHFITALAVVLTLSVVALPAAFAQETRQEAQQEAQVINGSLKTVDLEESKIVVTKEDDSEVTLVVTEDTTVRGPNGEPQTLSALDGHEGATLTAEFVQMSDQNVALTIQLVAN
jgi:Cu/Ag efflux protein CusF